MNLPPSILDIIKYSRGRTTRTQHLARAIAHEACRLQREADQNFIAYPGVLRTPLVVPSTED